MKEPSHLATKFLADHSEERARNILENYRWPKNEVRCPLCNGWRLYKEKRKGKAGFYRCPESHDPDAHRPSGGPLVFTVRTGTMLERSRVSLSKWLYCVTHVSLYSGISATNLATEINVTRRTAAFMLELINILDSHAWRLYANGQYKAPPVNGKSALAQRAVEKYHEQPEQNSFLMDCRRMQRRKNREAKLAS